MDTGLWSGFWCEGFVGGGVVKMIIICTARTSNMKQSLAHCAESVFNTQIHQKCNLCFERASSFNGCMSNWEENNNKIGLWIQDEARAVGRSLTMLSLLNWCKALASLNQTNAPFLKIAGNEAAPPNVGKADSIFWTITLQSNSWLTSFKQQTWTCCLSSDQFQRPV